MGKKNCCGCGACAEVCPKQAITMQEDENGFVYPVTDIQKCVGCGKCQKICGLKSAEPVPSLKKTYAAVSTSTDIMTSASGAMCAAFSLEVTERGGVVYGCVMDYEDGEFKTRHIRVNQREELERLKGSKYVQSDMRVCFSQIRQDLEDGREVLFCGTPCQISVLNGYLEKKYENLYTIEIICHGVPNERFFNDYLKCMERKAGKKIVGFKFRDKSRGWKFTGRITYQDAEGALSTEYFTPEESSYFQMFLNEDTYRECCYFCLYASENRAGDITVGDYWCIDEMHPELLLSNGGEVDEKKGVSCLVVNNGHGRMLIEKYGANIKMWPSTYEQAAKHNAQMLHPTRLRDLREKIFGLYREGYDRVEEWYQKEQPRL